MFEDLTTLKHVVPFQCSVSDMLCILQDKTDMRGAFSTNKIDLAAAGSQHPLVLDEIELTVTEDHSAFSLIQS